MKIENRSRKQSHKLDGIGVGRIRTFPFLPIPFTTPSLLKTSLNEEWKECVTSQKGLRRMYGLLTKCDVKMAGYWPSSFLRVYGPSRGS